MSPTPSTPSPEEQPAEPPGAVGIESDAEANARVLGLDANSALCRAAAQRSRQSQRSPVSRRSRRDEHLAAQRKSIATPIDADDVWQIASKGYPLGEAHEAMVRRNKRITVAYADLSERLARVIADGDPELDANWCTFASWSSHTIGLALTGLTHRRGYADVDPEPGGERRVLERVPLVRTALGRAARWKAAGLRAISAGNRAVFLEVGLAVATFLEHFEDRTTLDLEARGEGQDRTGHRELYGEIRLEDCWEREWKECWEKVEEHYQRVAALDMSWILPPNRSREGLQRGMRHYLLAMRSDDPQQRAEHVLTANILVAAYEQCQVQGYVSAGLALYSRRVLHRLVSDRTGDPGILRRLPSRLFAGLLTWRMKLHLGDEEVRLFHPVPPAPPAPPDTADPAVPASVPGARRNGTDGPILTDDAELSLPLLWALIDTFQMSHERPRDKGARVWTDYDDRMRTIVDLFRTRQRQQSLFRPPFDADEAARILSSSGTSVTGDADDS
jgi:hypothetical protein